MSVNKDDQPKSNGNAKILVKENRFAYLTKPSGITEIVDALRKQMTFATSYDDLVTFSSKAFMEFRRKIDLEDCRPVFSIKDLLYANAFGDSRIRTRDEGVAPNVVGKLDGQKISIVLDAGCTTCIISLKTVKSLNLNSKYQSLQSNASSLITVGDGHRVAPIGIVRGIKSKSCLVQKFKCTPYVLMLMLIALFWVVSLGLLWA